MKGRFPGMDVKNEKKRADFADGRTSKTKQNGAKIGNDKPMSGSKGRIKKHNGTNVTRRPYPEKKKIHVC